MAFTTYTDNKFVDAFHGKTTYTAPANIYMALSTTTPTVGGTNFTEPSGGAYARVAVPGSSFAAASAGAASNTAVVTFPTATASWGTITYTGFYDAASGGNLLSFDDLPASQAVATGVQIQFPVGQITDSNT